jgi:hypothetical protein
MSRPIFKDSQIANNRYYGLGGEGISVGGIRGAVPGQSLEVNDDGTLTYILDGYLIVAPEGWEAFQKDYMPRQSIYKQIIAKLKASDNHAPRPASSN